MTKSTGKRASQKRREDLFEGELRAAGAAAYLVNVARLAREIAPGSVVALGYEQAVCVVFTALAEVRMTAASMALAV